MSDLMDRVYRVIEEYDLHLAGAPVDLSPLEAICPVATEDLSRLGIAGFCYARTPATRETPATVVLCRSLTDSHRRIAYAHEVAHGLVAHSGAISLSDLDPWFHSQQEREAWLAAAMLLIPPLDRVQTAELTMEGLARACDVPVWLVELYARA